MDSKELSLAQAATKKIILPVDVSTIAEVEELINLTKDLVGVYKFGLQTIYGIGYPQLMSKVSELTSAEIFVDAKLKDIPHTMAEAAKMIAHFPVRYLTVYADAGIAGIKSVVEQVGPAIKVLVVTALTSLAETDVEQIYGRQTKEIVPRLADLALVAGAAGLICSPLDLAYLNNEKYDGLLKITPGIRPEWAAAQDQNRIMTPREAILAGSSHLVIGRPITAPPAVVGGTVQAAKLIRAEIAAGLQEMEIKCTFRNN